MNSEQLLYKNKFVRKLENVDIPSDQKQQFRKYYEDKVNSQKQNQIINGVQQKPSQTAANASLTPNWSYTQPIAPPVLEPKTPSFEKYTLVSINSRDRDKNLYPYQNNFKAFLGKTFRNVKRVEIVSSEVPNTDAVITNIPTVIQNNVMYWQNQEDYTLGFINNVAFVTNVANTIDLTVNGHGFTSTTANIAVYNSELATDSSITGVIDGSYQCTIIDVNTLRILYDGGVPVSGICSVNIGVVIYNVEFTPGNYTITSLSSNMTSSFNVVRRQNGQGEFHYFDVEANIDTDVMTFQSVKTTQLPSNPLSATAGSNIVTVDQISHGFKTGDNVKIIGAKTFAGLDQSILNGNFTVTILDFNTFTYATTDSAVQTLSGGGNVCLSGKDAPYRFLLGTEDTLIQFNIGFPNEDSSVYIGQNNPITTYTVGVNNIQIVGNYLRVTTTTAHGLYQSTVLNIISISTDSPVKITTSTPHGIGIPIIVYLRNTNCSPPIDGDFLATPTSKHSFTIPRTVLTAGTSGQVLYGGDKIRLGGLTSIPAINPIADFFVENIVPPYQFDAYFIATRLDPATIPTSIVETSQVTVVHPNHGFNYVTSINPSGTQFAILTTFLPNNYTGTYNENVPATADVSSTNSVDLYLPNHGLSTSDQIVITSSTTNPVIDGTYNIQVIDANNIKINFVFATFTSGTATVFTGDVVQYTSSNSLPKIDGFWMLSNRISITSISTGSVTSTITTSQPNNWNVGDTVVITGTNSTPIIDGTYSILSIINSSSFTIVIENPITFAGTTGIVQNKNTFTIKTNFEIVTPGTYAIIGRELSVMHYRITGDTPTSSSLGGIPLNFLNGNKRDIVKLIDTNTYLIRVNNAYATFITTGGGNSVTVTSQLHGLRATQANTNTGDKSGVLYRSISLEGENYLFLVSDQLQTVTTNSATIPYAFAKILLTESPGIMAFNSYVSVPMEFDHPVPVMDTLDFQMITSKGNLFNFNNTDYSFTLKITEIVNQPLNTYISSQTGKSVYGDQGNNDYSGGGGNSNNGAKAGQQNNAGGRGATITVTA